MKKSAKDVQRNTAKVRIAVLFEQAELRPELADRYMRLVDRLKKRSRVRLTPVQRKRVCRSCLAFLRPGITCTVRTKDKRLIIICKKCGRVHRYPFARDRR